MDREPEDCMYDVCVSLSKRAVQTLERSRDARQGQGMFSAFDSIHGVQALGREVQESLKRDRLRIGMHWKVTTLRCCLLDYSSLSTQHRVPEMCLAAHYIRNVLRRLTRCVINTSPNPLAVEALRYLGQIGRYLLCSCSLRGRSNSHRQVGSAMNHSAYAFSDCFFRDCRLIVCNDVWTEHVGLSRQALQRSPCRPTALKKSPLWLDVSSKSSSSLRFAETDVTRLTWGL